MSFYLSTSATSDATHGACRLCEDFLDNYGRCRGTRPDRTLDRPVCFHAARGAPGLVDPQTGEDRAICLADSQAVDSQSHH